MGKIVVITQSNYLPWRGYFDLLRSADEVVLLDSVQYTRQDWRNRNVIKGARGLEWLTIPVKGRYPQAIDETRIADGHWAKRHVRAIELAYRNAPCFAKMAPWLFGLLESVSLEPMLTRVNERTLRAICDKLGIKAKLRRCNEIVERERLRTLGATERLVALATAVGADRYLTAPAARAYLEADRFHAANIQVVWMSYEGYAPYPQLWGGFELRVSIVDLLLNTGPEASHYVAKS